MPYPQFDRFKLKIKPLAERSNKVFIEKDYIPVDSDICKFNEKDINILDETLNKIRNARNNNKPVVLAFGAHSIKNALAKVFIKLMEDGWITHLATNGAGIIHDWEFAFQGKTSEDVRANVANGEFGIWQETGHYINLAIVVGAYEGLGYGESVGKLISNESLTIQSVDELEKYIKNNCKANPDKTAAASDLIYAIQKFNLKSGKLVIEHPFKEYSVQAAAYRMNIPFTGHPMIGHDIIYTHPMNNGPAVGRTALRDFLTFAEQINNLDGGVYLSVGSAVMSPMIFEKSLSMSQNIAIQNDKHIDKHYMLIVDLAENNWNWAKDGEPPMDNPAYYLRYCKTFNRMGGKMRYLCADNRDLLLYLCRNL
ncbi:MAG TPA: hypothetical protein QF753_12580 [Victivallales bacterium]|nr:hypothetical protein [Victivallales bacterium]